MSEKLNIKKLKLCYLVWLDSGMSLIADKWQELDDIKAARDNIKSTYTTGFVVDENEDWLILATTIEDTYGQIRGGHVIYKKNILERKDFCLGQVKK